MDFFFHITPGVAFLFYGIHYFLGFIHIVFCVNYSKNLMILDKHFEYAINVLNMQFLGNYELPASVRQYNSSF